MGNMVLVNSGFHTRKNLSENYPLSLGMRCKKPSPALPYAEKVWRISVWRGAKLLACPGRSPVSGRICLWAYMLTVLYEWLSNRFQGCGWSPFHFYARSRVFA